METHNEYIYQTYGPRISLFMSRYTVHIPNTEEEEYVNRIIPSKDIPGYIGYLTPKREEVDWVFTLIFIIFHMRAPWGIVCAKDFTDSNHISPYLFPVYIEWTNPNVT